MLSFYLCPVFPACSSYCFSPSRCCLRRYSSNSCSCRWFVFRKVTLAKFADDVSWSWLLVSTSGSARVIQYDVGSSNYRGNLVGNFAINWFVDTRFWHPVLSHDADGAVLAGSREQLVRAVKEGAAVRCVQDGAATDFCFQAQNLEISPDEQHVAAQTLNQVGTQDGLGLSDSKSCSNAHWSFTIISSNGKREVSRWTVGKHEKRGRSSDRVATKWFVNHWEWSL